jgi:acyl-CoA reductase-like NAD-dependent aldehyde dehydrogenase
MATERRHPAAASLADGVTRVHTPTHWIDGAARPAGADEETYPLRDPATEELLATVSRGQRGVVDAAVAAARSALPRWAALSPNERRAHLRAVVARLDEAKEEIAVLLTRENGKPLEQARGEVAAAIDVSRSYVELGTHLRSGHQGAAQHELNFQHRQPRGVVACIIPWNFPVAVGLENVMPALVAGNTVVWKPSEKTPLTAARILQLAFGGLPAGVVNLVLGDGPHAGEPLVRHPHVDMVVFVGSERTGRRIGEICGASLKKCILELGGKDPLVVDETVDIDAAVRLAAEACFANAGQICTSTERMYVHRSVFDQFVDKLSAHSSRMRVDHGMAEGTAMGPLIDESQLRIVSGQVEDAIRRGAQLHFGGARLERPGFFYPPTVVTGVPDDSLLMQEETFGPVAPVQPFDDFEQAIALANSGRYGLAAIVCTTSAPRAIEAIQRIEAGMVKINTLRGKAPGGASEPFKSSGLGIGYGQEFLKELTREKSVHWRSTPR